MKRIYVFAIIIVVIIGIIVGLKLLGVSKEERCWVDPIRCELSYEEGNCYDACGKLNMEYLLYKPGLFDLGQSCICIKDNAPHEIY